MSPARLAAVSGFFRCPNRPHPDFAKPDGVIGAEEPRVLQPFARLRQQLSILERNLNRALRPRLVPDAQNNRFPAAMSEGGVTLQAELCE